MTITCAFCSVTLDKDDGNDTDIALTICKNCLVSFKQYHLTVFFNGTEVLLDTIEPTELDLIEAEEENEDDDP
jgi:hypothetical protein